MKKFIIGIVILLITTKSFTQTKSDWRDLQQELHKKGKIPKSLPWISLGVGIPTAIMGIAIGYNNDNNKSSIPLLVTGCALTLGSIPLFILAYPHPKPRKVKFNFSIDNQKTILPQRNAFAFKSLPALAVRINF